MAYIDTNLAPAIATPDPHNLSTQRLPRNAMVAVLEDDTQMSDSLAQVFEFLDLHAVSVPSNRDLGSTLTLLRPMAVIAGADMRGQDGCNVLMEIAQHDAELPVLMITGMDARMAGAIEAIEGIFGLTAVTRRPALPPAGDMVAFLAEAGRAGRCLSVLPV